jgi:acetyl esterase/lipase
MHQSALLYLLLGIFTFSCSKDLEQDGVIEDSSIVETKITLAPDSIFKYTYYSDSTSSKTLKIYTPIDWKEKGGQPCILFFHGALATSNQYKMQSKYFARRGIVAICINHRFTIPNFNSTIGLKDGHSAIRWVRKNHLLLGIDSTRLAVLGSSAGGAVAMSSYLCQDYNHSSDDLYIQVIPDALIAINPQLIERLILPEDAYDHPPTLFLQGDSDDLTPLSELKAYRNKALSRGADEIELIIYPGRGHGFFNYNESPTDYINTLMKVDSFLVDHGFI